MELKYGWAKSTKPENPGSNRTFMELKLLYINKDKARRLLF